MFPHPSHQPPAPARAFPTGAPGTAALTEHVLATGHGRWWTDRAERPRAVAVSCGDHALLAGDPTALTPADLAPLADHYVEATDRFLPLLGGAFDRITPWERMLYIHRVTVAASSVPRGARVRRLSAEDAPALAALDPSMAWIHDTWDGPVGLASSGLGWAAFHKGRVVTVACTRFLGSRYEDLACATAPEARRKGLALACVTRLVADVTERGHTASWCCSRDNRPSRLLAWTAGFRLDHEYVHHAAGAPSRAAVSALPGIAAAA
ncbi:GNAT family N-acetyltransferase [Streptomyces sp. NPDC014870]|uniref:GNAT family N-acetyltransferase n=1 Tax=Streptomyces sp. NPDC014870 TaxID=3364925 RepID=UPI0036FA81D3